MQNRYFIGITLPDELSRQITTIQRELFQPGKVMEPLTPHITLLHPNELMTLPPMYFVPKVKEAASKLLPIHITFTETALFDKRVLHIVVDSSELIKLQKQLVALLPEKVRAQYEIARPYTPHVTLIQAKPKQKLADALIGSFKTELDQLLPYEFDAMSLAQFTWRRPRIYDVQPV